MCRFFMPVRGCVHVSSFTGAELTHTQTHTDRNTHSLSLESSPTGGVCPGLSSLMIQDVIKRPLSCFICRVHMP